MRRTLNSSVFWSLTTEGESGIARIRMKKYIQSGIYNAGHYVITRVKNLSFFNRHGTIMNRAEAPNRVYPAVFNQGLHFVLKNTTCAPHLYNGDHLNLTVSKLMGD